MNRDYSIYKWLLALVAIFIFSGIFSISELRYSLSGKKTTAQITDAFEVSGRRGRKSLEVHYTFQEPELNVQRSGYDSMSRTWNVPADKKVEVMYIPGADKFRIAEKSDWIFVAMFAISGIALIGTGFYMYAKTNKIPEVLE